MKLASSPIAVFLACILGSAFSAEVLRGYHENIGIPAALRAKQREALTSRIFGGSPVLNPGKHPYIAGLLIDLNIGISSLCGGTLISRNRVLTAAHCWNDGYFEGTKMLVVLGSVRVYSGGTRVAALNVILHPRYNPFLYANDLGMVIIDYVTLSPYIIPVALPAGPLMNSTFINAKAEIVGFGSNNDGVLTSDDNPTLQELKVLVMNNTICQESYGDMVITSSVMCTEGKVYSGYGPCSGDSGGPVVYHGIASPKAILIGVMSFTASEGCTTTTPAGHTRINSHRDWINSNM